MSSGEDLFGLLLERVKAFANRAPTESAARTRARLIRVATKQFQENGYRRTSIDEIAREAGVAKGTVYVHFRNKAELLLFAIVDEKERYIQRSRHLLTSSGTPT